MVSILDHRVLNHRWCYDRKGYAVNGSLGFMHRFLMDYPAGEVDHKDGNGLNNTRKNLHAPSRSINKHRRHVRLSASGFYGVTKHKLSDRFFANIKLNYRTVYLGLFKTAEEAALAYDSKALEIHGENAMTNFMWQKTKAGWKQKY